MKQTEAVPAENVWRDIHPGDFTGNPFKRIGEDWMLITAGDVTKDRGNWNTMTASWGGLGVLWGKNVAFMFIRPCRHSYGFANAAGFFTLSFFKDQRKALALCGRESGRDTDKAAASGLTPIVFGEGSATVVGFKEASEIIICRKLYTHDFDPSLFLDPAIERNYPQKDYHRMFIGEIVAIKAR